MIKLAQMVKFGKIGTKSANFGAKFVNFGGKFLHFLGNLQKLCMISHGNALHYKGPILEGKFWAKRMVVLRSSAPPGIPIGKKH